MANPSTVKLTIALKDQDLDEERLERTTQNLLREIEDYDGVEQAGLAVVEETPEGAKSFGGFVLGILKAEVNFKNIKAVLAFLGERLSGKMIELEVEANGKKLKVKANNQEELVSVKVLWESCTTI